MLPEAFLDWWFAPWTYAAPQPHLRPLPEQRLAQRDGYRLWCARAGLEADLPRSFDPAWHGAAVANGGELSAAARLFSGLIAARAHDETILRQLPFADRKWCASVAATQPLQGCGIAPGAEAADTPEARGLLELAWRLQAAFPGMWPRLRLSLAPELAGRVDRALDGMAAAQVKGTAGAVRAQRCWQLCRTRAAGAAVPNMHSAQRKRI